MTDAGEPTTALLRRAIRELRELRAHVAALESAQREPIAVVGIGCRFPGGGDGPDAFFRAVERGVDGVREVPRDRWEIDAVYAPERGAPGKMSTRSGGFLNRVDEFDAAFFGISAREAAGMDPQQRLVLEVAWEALEDAAIPPAAIAGSRAGVFIGSCFNDYARLLAQPPGRGGSGILSSVIANRVSYFLDLRGPSMVVDTACSSSLVALDLAARNLRDGTCDVALAGGVNVILSPDMHVSFSQAGMMALDGKCKTFDARADGYSRSEGCGVVVLKRASDALDAGDRIIALIRGTAVNQDGATNGLSAPSGLAQQAVIRQALADGSVAADEVEMIEAHGTGTPLGDPIEVEALREVYGHPRAAGAWCALGSVKTNIGHLEAAAGIAGFIKAALCLSRGMVPPHLHFESLSPRISLEGTPFVIATEGRSWPRGERPRFASVSSFGIGGTNGHIVLAEAPAAPPAAVEEPDGARHVLTLSAHSEAALRALIERYARFLEAQRPPLADLCYTSNVGRAHLAFRAAFVARSIDELRAQLMGNATDGVFRGRTPKPGEAPLAPVPLPAGDADSQLVAAAARYASGADVDWAALARGPRRRIALPTYTFQRRRCWLEEHEIRPWKDVLGTP